MIEFLNIENLLALLTLTALEIVLGIDNVVFIAILVGRLEKNIQAKARRIGLALAMVMRILLLLTLSWLTLMTDPLFTILGHPVSGRDLVLLIGGMFLMAKATYEIHHGMEDSEGGNIIGKKRTTFTKTIIQIMLLDIVFSLDSVITAVGMARAISVMVVAIVVAVIIMMWFAATISHYIDKHPTLKMLALSFLLLIGVVLVADGFGRHIEKGYIYFAMGFSLSVEMLNIRNQKNRVRAA